MNVPTTRRSLLAAWSYRGFVISSVKRDFQARYRGSTLGVLWTLLSPLSMILVYTIVFSQLMRARLPGVDNELAYSIYLCAGILTWGFFAEIVTRSQTMFIENGNLLKKINFPRICLPAVVLLSASLNFAIIFALFIGFLLVTGNFPGWVIVGCVPLLLIQAVFSCSLGIVLGVLNVFFRDVGQLTGIVLQFWFWLTPIVYPLDVIPQRLKGLIELNPMTSLVQGHQRIFVNQLAPEWPSLLPVTMLAVLLALFALRLFRRRAGELVDEL